jgi:hypothetical protein
LRKLIVGIAVAVTAATGLTLVPGRVAVATPATRIEILPPVQAAAHAASADTTTEPGQATPFPLSHLAVQWHGDENAAIQVRWKTEAGGWQPWITVTADHDMSDGSPMVGSNLVRADDAVRVETAAADTVTDLRVVAIDTTHAKREVVQAAAADPAAADTAAAGTSSTSSTLLGVLATPTSTTIPVTPESPRYVSQPPVISRAQWGADESLRSGSPSFAPISKLIVHHTVTQNNDPDPTSTVRAIYAYHTQGNGWNDIGYNFLIDSAGRIYEGRYSRSYARGENPTGEDLRGYGVIGAHALNANTGSVGVALLGTFNDVAPSAAQLAALDDLLAWKADAHGVDPFGSSPYRMGDGSTKAFANISGHRDTYGTECPGDLAYADLGVIRQAVSSRIEAADGSVRGYWTAGRDGKVYPFGAAQNYGSMAGKVLNVPIAGLSSTPTGKGYWLLGGDGGIFSFGDAQFFGSTGNLKLNKPVVALQPTPTGKGYWLVASDGGIFAYGDAQFFGSTGAIRLNKPVVGMAATPSGKGYWLVASDGGIFAFGDAVFHGSTGSIKLNSPVAAMAASAAPGGGYWLVSRDGGIFAFDVPFRGSIPGLELSSYAGSVGMAPTPDGRGYYVLGADGGIFNFGSANFLGAKSGLAGALAAAGMAVLPAAV